MLLSPSPSPPPTPATVGSGSSVGLIATPLEPLQQREPEEQHVTTAQGIPLHTAVEMVDQPDRKAFYQDMLRRVDEAINRINAPNNGQAAEQWQPRAAPTSNLVEDIQSVDTRPWDELPASPVHKPSPMLRKWLDELPEVPAPPSGRVTIPPSVLPSARWTVPRRSLKALTGIAVTVQIPSSVMIDGTVGFLDTCRLTDLQADMTRETSGCGQQHSSLPLLPFNHHAPAILPALQNQSVTVLSDHLSRQGVHISQWRDARGQRVPIAHVPTSRGGQKPTTSNATSWRDPWRPQRGVSLRSAPSAALVQSAQQPGDSNRNANQAFSSPDYLYDCIIRPGYGISPFHCARRWIAEQSRMLDYDLVPLTRVHLQDAVDLKRLIMVNDALISDLKVRLWLFEARAYFVFYIINRVRQRIKILPHRYRLLLIHSFDAWRLRRMQVKTLLEYRALICDVCRQAWALNAMASQMHEDGNFEPKVGYFDHIIRFYSIARSPLRRFNHPQWPQKGESATVDPRGDEAAAVVMVNELSPKWRRLANGRWPCHHSCYETGPCKHVCCKEGLSQPSRSERMSRPRIKPESELKTGLDQGRRDLATQGEEWGGLVSGWKYVVETCVNKVHVVGNNGDLTLSIRLP